MNNNIQITNDDLWTVEFEFINMNFIKEITFKEVKCSDFACLTNDGKILLNKSDAVYQKHLPLVKEIMQLDDEQLEDDKGFYTVMKKVVPSFEKYSDEQIEQIVQKYNLGNSKQVFSTFCNLEKQRREIKDQYVKGNKKPFDIKSIIKKIIKRKGV